MTKLAVLFDIMRDKKILWAKNDMSDPRGIVKENSGIVKDNGKFPTNFQNLLPF